MIDLPGAATLPPIRWKLVTPYLEEFKTTNPGKHAERRNALKGLFR